MLNLFQHPALAIPLFSSGILTSKEAAKQTKPFSSAKVNKFRMTIGLRQLK
ncbi:hypothetical protein [Pedobacter frigoris]|uniref:hypothetical protein n=1 Tax=Pedobacter frigoris TaxID=2571272 RepID=UPI00292F2EC7|nr:hypothetical protein [Pedobacter frigoris]